MSFEPVTPRRFHVTTFGCQMNEADSEQIAAVLQADGLERAPSIDDADVIVLNTCCIRENADNKLYGTLGHLKSLKAGRPGVEIVVGGCLAQKDRERVRERAPHVDVVLGTHNVGRVAELLGASRRNGPVTEILDAVAEDHDAFPTALAARREVGFASWLTIQVGCDNSCAFCIVPAVRGPEMSRPFGQLLAEVEGLAAAGVTEVTLLGQNVNSYGRDLTLRLRAEPEPLDRTAAAAAAGAMWLGEGRRAIRPLFADLLRAVGSVPGIRRVRYTSPHPKDLRPDTIAAMADTPAVCEHLHLPLQSGSDAVLAAMHRGYTAERYLERLADARRGIDGLAVSTDIIVGFPGETDADFDATLEVAAEAAFDSAFTFVFSPREGTEAASATDRFVSHAVAVERMERLRSVVERSSRVHNQARIGRIDEVIVEGPSKRDTSRLTGRTRQNKLVHFESAAPLRAGTYARVEITASGLSSLSGRLLEVTSPARHTTRIPVTSA